MQSGLKDGMLSLRLFFTTEEKQRKAEKSREIMEERAENKESQNKRRIRTGMAIFSIY